MTLFDMNKNVSIGILMIMVILLIGLFVFFFKIPNFTGMAINEPKMEIKSVTPKDAVASCLLNPPLYCKAWIVSSEENYVGLELMNNADYDLVIDEVQISKCASYKTTKIIWSGDTGIIRIPCLITAKEDFYGNVIINYKRIGSDRVQMTNGFLAEKL